MYGLYSGLKDPNNEPDDELLERAKEKAMTKHKRKVSQFQSLKDDFSEYLTEDVSGYIAREVMKEINPNDKSGKTVAENSVKTEFAKFDDDDVIAITNRQNEVKLVKLREDLNGLDDRTFQSAVDKAITLHSRKLSQLQSIRADMFRHFDEDEAKAIASHLMKGMAPMAPRQDKKRGSIQMDELDMKKNNIKSYGNASLDTSNLSELRQEVNTLRDLLVEKDEIIADLNKQLEFACNSKIELALSANRTINELRSILLALKQ